MKLAFYSDQIVPSNRQVDAFITAILPPSASIGFVPSTGDPDGNGFADRRTYYAGSGLRLVCAHDPAVDNEQSLNNLLECDAIHLSGGDTRQFLARLKAAKMIEPLREYSRRGGMLIGVSAGAILLTPNIAVDALFSGGNPKEMTDEVAMGLVEFEFFPHLHNDPGYLPQLSEYSRGSERRIFGCPDGSGIVVENQKISMVGDGVAIQGGRTVSWRD